VTPVVRDATLIPHDHSHQVQFYESSEYLCEAVSRFVADGIIASQPTVVIATEAHRARITDRLNLAGYDINRAFKLGTVCFHDAHASLAQFMINDLPDPDLFRDRIGGVIRKAMRQCPQPVNVRAYGEMVNVLWEQGNKDAALRLEELWNELAGTHDFSLMCAYAMTHFTRESDAPMLEEICRRHSHVIPAESFTVHADNDARAREILRLQQRANALEHEIESHQRTEDELRKARDDAERASRVKSDFLAVMSHELRTPLNAILGYRELMAQEIGGPVTGAQRLYLDRIKTGADQLTHLIDQILSLSRIEAGAEKVDLEPVDIRALVTDTAALIAPSATQKHLMLNVTSRDDALICVTDAYKVTQILLNLMANALKFTSEGGIEIGMRRSGDFATITVRDSGIGIDADDLDRIFDAFVQVNATATRAHGGTGLGLAVSRHLARLLGGDLQVESTLGTGSCFTLSLPLAQVEAAPIPADLPVAQPQAKL
jgi:signal transduction histidine kinase